MPAQTNRPSRAKQFGACLLRELHAHAWTLPLAACFAPLLTCALASTLLRSPPHFGWLVAIATYACALFLGSQSLACDMRDEGENSIQVLRRSPAGFPCAIFAKLSIVVLGVALSYAALRILAPLFEFEEAASAWHSYALVSACAFGGISLAASTWIPKASLALPCAFLVSLLLAMPTGIAWFDNPWVRPTPSGARIALGLALPFAGIVCVVATIKLLIRERSEVVTGLAGAGVCLAASLPFVGAQVVSSEDRVRLDSKDFTIDRAYLSPSARILWLTCRNAKHSAGYYLLRVDLETRDVEEFDRHDQRFEVPGHPNQLVGRSSRILLRTLAQDSAQGQSLDAETGEPRATRARDTLATELGARDAQTIRLIDGALFAFPQAEGEDDWPEPARRVFPFGEKKTWKR